MLFLCVLLEDLCRGHTILCVTSDPDVYIDCFLSWLGQACATGFPALAKFEMSASPQAKQASACDHRKCMQVFQSVSRTPSTKWSIPQAIPGSLWRTLRTWHLIILKGVHPAGSGSNKFLSCYPPPALYPFLFIGMPRYIYVQHSFERLASAHTGMVDWQEAGKMCEKSYEIGVRQAALFELTILAVQSRGFLTLRPGLKQLCRVL